MWLLDVRVAGSTVRYYLTAGSFSVGRKEGCHIHLGGNGSDASISRLHATIHVMTVQAKSLASPEHVPELFLSDHSKHGTFINNDRIASHEDHRRVSPGDVVRLGLHATISIQYSPMMIAVSPRLSSFEYREVHSLACRLGAALCQPTPRAEWFQQGVAVLAFVYVTNDVDAEDVPLLFGLLYRYTLVTPDYLSTLADVLRGTPHLPMTRWPQPRSVPASRCRSLADRQYFKPAPTFFDGDEFLTDHMPEDPSFVFRTLRLLVIDDHLWQRYDALVTAGGGRLVRGKHIDGGTAVMDIEGNAVLPLDALVPDKVDAHGFGTYVLVARGDFRALAEVLESHRTHERDALRRNAFDGSNTLASYFLLWERGLCIVDEENIHAALYANDAAKEFRSDAPGVLCRSAMDELPEVEERDSNATEDGIAPYRPKDCSAPRASSPVRVCTAQQLSSVRHRKADEVLSAERRQPTSGQNHNDLYTSWKSAAAAAASGSRTSSPTRRAVPPPSSTVSALRATAPPPPTRISATPANASPKRFHSPQKTSAWDNPILQPTGRTVSPARRGSLLFKSTATTAGSQSDRQLIELCNEFEHGALATIAADSESACERILATGYVDGPCLATIRNANATFEGFLKALGDAEIAMASSALSASTRRTAYRLREKIDTIQRAIRASHRAVGIAAPSSMPSPRRYSSPAHSRQTSPSRLQR